ncbi:MAG: hypothetical protein AAGD05_15310, partial [Bacteroidota bacterium]
FFLPFLRTLQPTLPQFDFSIPGVTSISADIHKYGFAAKGASLVLYRNEALRKAQFYVYTQWSGGIYASPTMTGTRPGGAIAAAWAIVNYMGREGYLNTTSVSHQTAKKIKAGIEQIPELKILGTPQMSIMAMASDQLDIYEVGDEMGLMGWTIDRQQDPPSLHLTITPAHEHLVDAFLADLQVAVQKARKISWHGLGKRLQVQPVKGLQKVLPESFMSRFQKFAAKHSAVGGKRSAAMYGMMGELKADGNLEEMVKTFLDKLMK